MLNLMKKAHLSECDFHFNRLFLLVFNDPHIVLPFVQNLFFGNY